MCQEPQEASVSVSSPEAQPGLTQGGPWEAVANSLAWRKPFSASLVQQVISLGQVHISVSVPCDSSWVQATSVYRIPPFLRQPSFCLQSPIDFLVVRVLAGPAT